MNVLAIDTSTRDLSLALATNGKIVKFKNSMKSKDLAREMPQLFEKFLKGTGVPLNKLNAVAVGLGPGSFTGLRVGVAGVQALSFALDIAASGISSLDAIAYHARKKGKKICVLVDARRNLFYGSMYSSDGHNIKRQGDHFLLAMTQALKDCTPGTWIVGDACALIPKEIIKAKGLNVAPKTMWKPQARHLLVLLDEQSKKAKKGATSDLVPIYLYPEDCQAVRHK